MKIKLSLNGRVMEQRKVKRESQFVMTCPILPQTNGEPLEVVLKANRHFVPSRFGDQRQPAFGVSTQGNWVGLDSRCNGTDGSAASAVSGGFTVRRPRWVGFEAVPTTNLTGVPFRISGANLFSVPIARVKAWRGASQFGNCRWRLFQPMVFHSRHDGLAEYSNRTRKNPLFRETETIPFMNKTPSDHLRLGCCDGWSRWLIFATGQRLENVFAWPLRELPALARRDWDRS